MAGAIIDSLPMYVMILYFVLILLIVPYCFFGRIVHQNWLIYKSFYEPEKGWLIPENRVGPG